MYRAILLLVVTSLSIDAYAQQVTENLVQELYYVDGKNYRAISYDIEQKTSVEIKLKTFNIPTEDDNSYVTFYYSKDGERGFTKFNCEFVENTIHDKDPIVYFSTNSNALEIVGSDSTENIRITWFSYYLLEPTKDTLFLYKLLEYPKMLIRTSKSIFRHEVEVKGDTTYHRSYSNDWLSSQSLSVELPDGITKEYFKWMTGEKPEKKPYSWVKSIIQKKDSTITYIKYDVTQLSNQTKLYKLEKKIEVKDKSGNLIFYGRYRSKRFGKQKGYIPTQEIEYQYFGKELERRHIKTPEGNHLIEIRRKYADSTQ